MTKAPGNESVPTGFTYLPSALLPERVGRSGLVSFMHSAQSIGTHFQTTPNLNPCQLQPTADLAHVGRSTDPSLN